MKKVIYDGDVTFIGQEIRQEILDKAFEIDLDLKDYEAFKNIEKEVLSTLSEKKIIAYNCYMARITRFSYFPHSSI